MVELNDIDTSAVGFIAFWNALNYGASSVDPVEVLSYSGISTYDPHDNGIEGTISNTQTGRVLNWRVKTDGWFIVWIDRTNDFAGGGNGYWDIVRNGAAMDTSNNGSSSPFPTNQLEHEIDMMRQECSNSGEMTFNEGDVGIYNYEHTSATTVRMVQQHARNTVDGGDSSNFDLSYTSGTTRHYHAGIYSGLAGFDCNFSASLDSTTLFNTGPASLNRAYDALSDQEYTLPNSGTMYNHSISVNDRGASSGTWLLNTVILIYS